MKIPVSKVVTAEFLGYERYAPKYTDFDDGFCFGVDKGAHDVADLLLERADADGMLETDGLTEVLRPYMDEGLNAEDRTWEDGYARGYGRGASRIWLEVRRVMDDAGKEVL